MCINRKSGRTQLVAWVLLTSLSACAPPAQTLSNTTDACGLPPAQIGTFVEIPQGSFTKGASPIYAEEAPSLRLQVNGFLIQSHEVTNAQFAAFVEATDYLTDAERGVLAGREGAGSAVFIPVDKRADSKSPWALMADANWKTPEGSGSSITGRENHPAVHVSKRDAEAYARWAGGRLPSEVEWEYVASLGLPNPDDQSSGAYGDDGPRANTWQGIFPVIDQATDGFSGSSPIGCFGPDNIGLHDMIGNVWEWTDTPYGSQTHTIKGGSYLCSDNFCVRYRPAARQPQETNFSSNHIGFRIIKTDTP